MKLAIFGSTGNTGFCTLAGHTVKALVRDASKLSSKLAETKQNTKNLTIIEGSALNVKDVQSFLTEKEPFDAIIISLGGRVQSDQTCSKGQKAIQDAMDALPNLKKSRMVVVTSMGVGPSWNDLSWFLKPIMWMVIGTALADKEIQEDLIRKSGYPFVILRPAGLNDGPVTGVYQSGLALEVKGAQKISRADVADFLLKSLKGDEYVGKAFTLAY